MAKIQGTETVLVNATSRLQHAQVRQNVVSNAIAKLNSEGKEVKNIIDGPIQPFGPLGNCYSTVTILWEAETTNPTYKPAPQPSNTSSSGGCYVATCVYGSYDCPQVWTLRRYRDDILATTWYGRLFIRLYYAISPTLVKWFGKTTWFRKIWKPKLDKMVEELYASGIENTPYSDKQW